MKTLWELFAAFFRIGAFTFGGGYAMLSLIQKEVVENKKWATDVTEFKVGGKEAVSFTDN